MIFVQKSSGSNFIKILEVFTVWEKNMIPVWKLFDKMLLILDFIINSTFNPKLIIMCDFWLRISIISNIGLDFCGIKCSNQNKLKKTTP